MVWDISFCKLVYRKQKCLNQKCLAFIKSNHFLVAFELIGVISRKVAGNTAQRSVYPVGKRICTFQKVTELSQII